MSNIRLDVGYKIVDGSQISFYAPCDFTEVDNLIIYYPSESGEITSHTFAFKDAQEKDFKNLIVKDTCVNVILSLTKSCAYIQNPLVDDIITTTDRELKCSKKGGLRFNKIYGKTEQTTTTGKNLFNGIHVGFAIDSSGVINNNSNYVTSDYIEIELNTPYFFSNVGSVNEVRAISYYDVNKQFIGYQGVGTNTANSGSLTFKNEQIKYLRIVAPIGLETQVEKGSVATSYEPFTGGQPSPNPEYPQELESVGQLSNLLDCKPFGTKTYEINGVSITPIFNSKGDVDYFVLNGTTELQSNSSRTLNLHVPVEKNTDYVLSGSHSNTGVYLYAEFGGNYYPAEIKGCKFNSGEHTEIAIELGSYANSTFNNEKVYPMLVRADSIIETYRPYTGVKEIVTNIYGNNLVSVKNAYGHYKEILTENNGDVIANGTDEEQTRFAYIELGKRELLGKKITYGFSKATAKNSMNVKIIIMFGNANIYVGSRIGVGIENTTLGSKETITLPSEFPSNADRVIMLVYGHNSTGGADTVTYEKLFACIGEDGSYSPYSPIQSLIIPTPNGLNGIKVTDPSLATYTDKNGDMWCTDERDYARGKNIQRIGIKVFDGTENWLDGLNELNPCFKLSIAVLKTTDSLPLCNHYKYEPYPYLKEGRPNIFGWESTFSVVYFATTLTTVEEFKVWLAEEYAKGTPVTVQYILREPIETDLTAEEMENVLSLETNDEITTILTDSKVEPLINVSYGKTENTASTLLAENLSRKSLLLIKAKVANNLTTTEEGFYLDARMGKELYDMITTLSDRVTTLENK